MGQARRSGGNADPKTEGSDRGDDLVPDRLGFEDALDRLGRVVEALEGGDLGLDAALARYEEGVRLLVRCRSLLDGAEQRVALLTGVDVDGTPRTEPFDAQATTEPSPNFANGFQMLSAVSLKNSLFLG